MTFQSTSAMSKLLHISALLLCCVLAQEARAQSGVNYDPENPADPQAVETTDDDDTSAAGYDLTLVASPAGAGYVSASSESPVDSGTVVTVYATAYSGCTFNCWLQGEDTVSTTSTYQFTMPAEDVTLTAVFTYEPESPDDPEAVDSDTGYTLTLEASPSMGGYVSSSSESPVEEGEEVTVSATAYSDFAFSCWLQGEDTVSTTSSYQFTMPAADVTLTAVFTYEPESPDDPSYAYVEVNIYNPGWATLYYGSVNLQVPDALKAYTASAIADTVVTLSKLTSGIIPAGTAVLLRTSEAYEDATNPNACMTYVLTLTDDDGDGDVAVNLLHGTDTQTDIEESGYTYYQLSLNSDEEVESIGFYYQAEDGVSITNGAHKAYLAVEGSSSVKALGLSFNDETTGIASVETAQESVPGIYTLQGLRLSARMEDLPAGLYIIDGRKYFIK